MEHEPVRDFLSAEEAEADPTVDNRERLDDPRPRYENIYREHDDVEPDRRTDDDG